MEKEIVKRENIKIDLRNYFKDNIKRLVFSIIFLLPIGYPIFLLSLYPFVLSYKPLKTIILIVYGIICLFSVLYEVTIIIIGLNSVSKGKFEITSNWVVKKMPRQFSTFWSYSKPYRLRFASKNEKYAIPSGMNYRWSSMNAMEDHEVYRCTALNDEFYLVSIGKRKNIVAYNKKWFELENEIKPNN